MARENWEDGVVVTSIIKLIVSYCSLLITIHLLIQKPIETMSYIDIAFSRETNDSTQ